MNAERIGHGRQSGAISAELVAVGLVVAMLVAAVVSLDLADGSLAAGRTAVCRLFGGTCDDAPAAAEDVGPSEQAARVAALRDRARRREDRLRIDAPESAGSVVSQLHDRIRERLEAGDVDVAEALDQRLEMYLQLARGQDWQGSERGFVLVESLLVPDEVWEGQVEASTEYLPQPPGANVRFTQVPRRPGGGLVVMDFFIPTETSGIPPVELGGDDRGFNPDGPLDPDLGLGESRVVIVMDLDTGRGVIYQSPTCNVFYDQCRQARPIATDMDERTQFVPELSDERSGPYIAPTNRYEISRDPGGVRLQYDALNSMTWPVISVDGDVVIPVAADGTVSGPQGCMDDYPSVGIYQYRPGQQTRIVEQRRGQDVFRGAPGGC